MIVILYGPMASGKTRRGAEFLRHFGCKKLVDPWDGNSRLHDGDLALTNEQPPFKVKGAKIVSIVEAKSAVTAKAKR